MSAPVYVELRLPFDSERDADAEGWRVVLAEDGETVALRGIYPEAQAREIARTLNGMLRGIPVVAAPLRGTATGLLA